MVRRTIYLPESVDKLVRERALEGESFSAAVARLVQQGAAAERGGKLPRYVGSGKGPTDLGRRAEQYLRELIVAR
jgi:hypothetical protein